MAELEDKLLAANTENGKDWLKKYNHPPGTKGASYNGYPDRSTVSCIHSEFRLNGHVNLFTSDAGAGGTGTRLYLNGPGVFNPHYLAGTVISPNTDNRWSVVIPNTTITRHDVLVNYSRYRSAYNSSTFQHDATAFTNEGMVYVAQFNPGVTVYTAATFILRMLDFKQYAATRKYLVMLCESTTKDDFAAFMSTIALHQNWNAYLLAIKSMPVDSDESRMKLLPDDAPRATLSATQFQIVELGRGIRSPSDITMMSPKSYVEKSIEGCFIVHAVNEDINAWKPVSTGSFTSSAGDPNVLMYCGYEYQDETINQPYILLFGDSFAANDLPWGTWSWSYTYFDGIDNTATPVPPTQIKTIQGIEWSPMPRTIVNSMTLPPAYFDPTALTTAAVLTQARQDAVAAKFNAGPGAAMVTKLVLENGPGMIDALVGKPIKADDGHTNDAVNIKQAAEREKEVGGETLGTERQAETVNNHSGDVRTSAGHNRASEPWDLKTPGDPRHQTSRSLTERFGNMHVAPRRRRSISRSRSQPRRSVSRRRSLSRGRSSSRNRSTSRRRQNHAPLHKKNRQRRVRSRRGSVSFRR